MTDLQALRRSLHQQPELAYQEKKTVEQIRQYITSFSPDQIIEPIAETGIAFVFKGNPKKPRVMFRAELDALPILESKDRKYTSQNKGTSHACGHDGHMTMVAGIASRLDTIQNRGDVILFFQPAEEIGDGAKKAMKDPTFKDLQPDYVFGLHNLPEHKAQKILLRKGTFACSSVGLKVQVNGASSHAAYPGLAQSPLEHISGISEFIENHNTTDPFFLTTLTYMRLGEPSFGITPGHLEMYLTLRALTDEVLDKNKKSFIDFLHNTFHQDFTVEIQETDYFPTTKSWDQGNDIIETSAKNIGLEVEYMDKPIRWSEDFGYYTQKIPGAFFGLGLGSDTPLHHQDYDFNDDVLASTVALYIQIIEQISQQSSS